MLWLKIGEAKGPVLENRGQTIGQIELGGHFRILAGLIAATNLIDDEP